jgi:signal transduction histidine kinase
MAEILQDQFAGPLNSRQAVYVRAIEQSGKRLLDVVNGILSYTYLLANQVQLQREHCELAYLLNVCAVSQRVKADAKQQTLTVLVEPPGLTAETDPAAVAELLKRLLDNAVKFTPPCGKVGVLARPGPVPATVQIVVWDTGIGVPGAGLASIVKPFTQADGGLTRNHEGAGMGLAYVDRVVTLLGGRLDLEPNPGGGSRFIVTLPGPAA